VFTATDEVAEQPFEGSVTVIVYVPAALTVGFVVVPPETIPGPDQLNVAPLVLDEPLNVTVFAEQVNVCADPAFALGVPVLAFTTTELFAVHPFEGSVTVIVYTPAVFTEGLAVVAPETIPGPDQVNVAPAAADDPFSVTVAEEQEMVCVFPAFASGLDVLAFTTTELFEVQPLAGSVTVN
jgi:hypothetical protein